MKIKVSKKAFDSGNNLHSSCRSQKKIMWDMIQFGVIPQRFKQEMGRGQGHAAGRGKQEASKKAGKAAWNKAALKDPSENTAL